MSGVFQLVLCLISQKEIHVVTTVSEDNNPLHSN